MPAQPPSGCCLVPLAAMINHSCGSNTNLITRSSEIVVRSRRALSRDEELTISYVCSTEPREERQSQLADLYVFMCRCATCRLGPRDHREILTGNPETDRRICQARARLSDILAPIMLKLQAPDDAKTSIRAICEASGLGRPWPLVAHPLPLLLNQLARSYEARGQLEKALRLRVKLSLQIDLLSYGERLHPTSVEQFMHLFLLEWYVTSPFCLSAATAMILPT